MKDDRALRLLVVVAAVSAIAVLDLAVGLTSATVLWGCPAVFRFGWRVADRQLTRLDLEESSCPT